MNEPTLKPTTSITSNPSSGSLLELYPLRRTLATGFNHPDQKVAYGNFFDVRTKTNVVVKSLSFHSELVKPEHAGSVVTVQVFTKSGSYTTGSRDAFRWRQICKTRIPRGAPAPMMGTLINPARFEEVLLEADTLQSFFLLLSEPDIIYSRFNTNQTGDEVVYATNDDMDMYVGAGVGRNPYNFWSGMHFRDLFRERIWHGAIHYRVEMTAPPTRYPTNFPTLYPTAFPTPSPTSRPTPSPTDPPTHSPSVFPTRLPSHLPSTSPPSFTPTRAPFVDVKPVVAQQVIKLSGVSRRLLRELKQKSCEDAESVLRNPRALDKFEKAVKIFLRASVKKGGTPVTIKSVEVSPEEGCNAEDTAAAGGGDRPIARRDLMLLGDAVGKGGRRFQTWSFSSFWRFLQGDSNVTFARNYTAAALATNETVSSANETTVLLSEAPTPAPGPAETNLYTTILGEYRPPPFIDFSALVADAFEDEGEVFVEELKKADPVFEEVAAVETEMVSFPLPPTPSPTPAPYTVEANSDLGFILLAMYVIAGMAALVLACGFGFLLAKRRRKKKKVQNQLGMLGEKGDLMEKKTMGYKTHSSITVDTVCRTGSDVEPVGVEELALVASIDTSREEWIRQREHADAMGDDSFEYNYPAWVRNRINIATEKAKTRGYGRDELHPAYDYTAVVAQPINDKQWYGKLAGGGGGDDGGLMEHQAFAESRRSVLDWEGQQHRSSSNSRKRLSIDWDGSGQRRGSLGGGSGGSNRRRSSLDSRGGGGRQRRRFSGESDRRIFSGAGGDGRSSRDVVGEEEQYRRFSGGFGGERHRPSLDRDGGARRRSSLEGVGGGPRRRSSIDWGGERRRASLELGVKPTQQGWFSDDVPLQTDDFFAYGGFGGADGGRGDNPAAAPGGGSNQQSSVRRSLGGNAPSAISGEMQMNMATLYAEISNSERSVTLRGDFGDVSNGDEGNDIGSDSESNGGSGSGLESGESSGASSSGGASSSAEDSDVVSDDGSKVTFSYPLVTEVRTRPVTKPEDVDDLFHKQPKKKKGKKKKRDKMESEKESSSSSSNKLTGSESSVGKANNDEASSKGKNEMTGRSR